MSETLPIVIGIAVSLFIVHYILSKPHSQFIYIYLWWDGIDGSPRRNHPPHPPHPHHDTITNNNNSNSIDVTGTAVNPAIATRETEEQLRIMFPNVPASVLRFELLRATSMQSAIEQLLSISSSYPLQSPMEVPMEVESDSGKKSSGSSNKVEAISRVDAVDQETWTKDSTVRERLLKQKKAVMLQEARK